MSTTDRPVRTRFAPSPTGKPHLGGGRTALFDWLYARRHNGQFILRIEDTDRERYDPDSVTAIFDGLRRLGLNWDEGPDVGGKYGPYTQSERLDIYHKHANDLLAKGHLYKCWCACSRDEVDDDADENDKPPPGYNRHCRNLSDADRAALEASGKPYVLRLKVPLDGVTILPDASRGSLKWDNKALTDLIMMKSDGYPTYHLASVIDDHLMEITHVMRGDEWLGTAPLHVMLYKFFGWDAPVFVHLPKVMGPDGQKLSKRKGDAGIDYWLDIIGALPEPLVNRLTLTGWNPGGNREVLSPAERIAEFDIARLVPHDAAFDLTKLAHYQGLYIRALPVDEFTRLVMPFLVRGGIVGDNPTEAELAVVSHLMPMLQTRVKLLGEAAGKAKYIYTRPTVERKKLLVKGPAEMIDLALSSMHDALDALATWDVASIDACVRNTAAEKGLKKVMVSAVGAALSGENDFLPLFDSIWLIGKTEVLARLTVARAVLASPDTDTPTT